MSFAKKAQFKGSSILAPLPAVIVTCGDMKKSNALTIAWTGTVNSIPPKTYISVRPERYSYNIIKQSGEFVINLVGEDLVKECDYLGVRSGRNEDKLANLGLTVSPATQVSVPMLDKSPVTIECKVCDIVPLGSHDMFLADVVAINVAEEIIDEKGKICHDKARLIAYSPGEYYSLGKKLGSFGYSVKKPQRKKRTAK